MTIFGISCYKWIRPFGYFALFISVSTWVLDLAGLVYACPYCQVQRTMIGVLAILLIMRKQNIYTDYITLTFGGFGAYVAALQMFNNFYKSAYDEYFIYLATCAFFILVAQMYAMLQLNKFKKEG